MSTVPESVRILHAEDDPALADLVQAHLEREDDRFTVDTAHDANEGLRKLTATPYDCIVSDYDMPGQNGIEFLKAVRNEHPTLPFLLFTGKGSEEIASDAISAGVTDYLQKGSGTEQYQLLANRIRNAVARSYAHQDRKRQLSAIETATEGIAILDDTDEFLYVNEAFANHFGYTPTELIGSPYKQLYEADAVDQLANDIIPWVRESGHWHGELTGRRADDSAFPQTVTIATSNDDELVWTIRDVTKSRERERRFEAVFDNTYTFVGLLDPNGTVLEANETALSFGGLDRDEVVGQHLWETYWFQLSAEARATAQEAVEQAADGDLFQADIPVQGKNREVVIDFSVRPVTNQAGDVTLLVPEGRDITDRVRYKRQLETLIDNLPGMVYRCRNERGWPMEEIRGTVHQLTGYEPIEIESRDQIYGNEIIHSEDRDDVWAAVQSAIDDREAFELTYRIRTKDGEIKHVWERGIAVYDASGGVEALEGFVMDVGQRESLRVSPEPDEAR
jgi:PAS domain S-box-containing protein